MSQDIDQLFENAWEEGNISDQSKNALAVMDYGNEIQNALGCTVDSFQASEAVLVTVMPDDSGSIDAAGNAQAVRDGHNMVLDSLRAAKQKDDILVHARYLNGTVLYPYVTLEQAVEMDELNYCHFFGTPLYDQTVLLLGTILAKQQEFQDSGVPVRTITLLITDGEDLHSRRAKPAMVRSIVEDMLASENHIIAAMGVESRGVDFREVFREMGIRDNWILTPGDDPASIRSAFRMFSRSAAQASQSAASFSQSSYGGFGS